MTSGPLRYYAPIQGHELVTRRDLHPSEPDHPHAGNWYYALQLGPLEHKLPPIVAHRWRRVTFIVTSGDRFMNAHEINDLFEQESPVGQLYVKLKEMGIPVEREWLIDEQGIAYQVDLALPVGDAWLPVTFGGRTGRHDSRHCERGHACEHRSGDDQNNYNRLDNVRTIVLFHFVTPFLFKKRWFVIMVRIFYLYFHQIS